MSEFESRINITDRNITQAFTDDAHEFGQVPPDLACCNNCRFWISVIQREGKYRHCSLASTKLALLGKGQSIVTRFNWTCPMFEPRDEK